MKVVAYPVENKPGHFTWTALVEGPGDFQLDCQLFGLPEIDKLFQPYVKRMNERVNLTEAGSYLLGGGIEVTLSGETYDAYKRR